MQVHIDNSQRINFKIIVRLFALILLFLFIVFVLFGVIIYPTILNNKVATINKKAKNHFNFFTAYYKDLSHVIDLPDNGTFYIVGENADNSYYLAYSGDNIQTETVIYGNKQKINGYWAIKITDNKIVQAWASNYPLSKEQLIDYSIKKQKKQFSLFENTMNTKAIGYYENSN